MGYTDNEVVKMAVSKIFALVALLIASGCNFYTAGILYKRYDKVAWLNIIVGVFLFYCAIKASL